MSGINNFQSNLRRHGAPVSIALIAIIVATFLFEWMGGVRAGMGNLIFMSETAAQRPWTFFTYPFGASAGLLGVLFGGMWLWGIGAFVEREMGSSRYAIVLGATTVLASLCLWVGSSVVGQQGFLAGPWIMLTAITVIWGTRHPMMAANFMMVIPLQAKWIALISVAFVFFGVTPMLAPFAVLPLAIVWAFAANKLPISYSEGYRPAKRDNRVRQGGTVKAGYFEDVKKREQEREERERLRKLFESSMIDNTDPERKAE